MREFSLDIGGKEVKCNTTKAKEQKEALHICLRTQLIVALNCDMSDMGLVSSLASVSFEDSERLAALVLKGNAFIDGVEVAENLFTDNIQDYYLLLMKMLVENLAPFWRLRGMEGATPKA